MQKTVSNKYGESIEVEIGESPELQKEALPLEAFKGGLVQRHTPVAINLCSSHSKDEWLGHTGYIDNHDGTISCKFCPWGTPLAGYYKCFEGKIIDLRTLNRA